MVDLLRCPAYAVPLVVNLTGSVWFFLLVGENGGFSILSSGVWGHRLLGERSETVSMANELWDCRVESDGADYEFVGVFVYCSGRLVGGGEGHFER